MIISVASGKGGTGKTTVATGLARAAYRAGSKTSFLDCDVEEPNAHIFLEPDFKHSQPVHLPVPKVDEELCTACGACGEICAFSAIVVIGKKVLTFHELCHGCGGCTRVCPEQAITETGRELGILEAGASEGMDFAHGKLRIGEAMSPPLIHELVQRALDAPPDMVSVIDCPPGTSCPVIMAVRSADFVVLVTEPTPFGLHDLKLAVEMTRELGLPLGVVVNRCDVGNRDVFDYCREEGLPVLLEIPDDRRVAEAYSRGRLPDKHVPEIREMFDALFRSLQERVTERSAAS